ncbi:MAG: bifunctional UDP-sugar hydrolase/5'-nucleotidase [Armatimonadota bacterium]
MKKNIFLILAVLIIAFFLSFNICRAADLEIVILHTNDIHGYAAPHTENVKDKDIKAGGLAHISTLIKEERDKNPGRIILLDGGDMYQGDPVSNIFQGKPIADIMNEMGYDASVVGNHEFDWGQDVLFKRISQSKFPVLCANVRNKQGQLLFKPYIIKEIEGVKVAVIGLTGEDTPFTTSPKVVDDLTFENPEKVFGKYYPELKQKCADIIVVLSHMGKDNDIKLVKNMEGADVIIGAHTHIPLHKPIIIKGVPVTQAGCKGEYLGKMVLVVDKDTKKIKKFTKGTEITKIDPSKIKEDPKIANMVNHYNNLVKSKMEEVLAVNKTDLINKRKGKANKKDIPLGNFICDVMQETSGADMTFYNPGGIRDSFYKGEITFGDVFKCLPFDNTLVTMNIKGKNIVSMLNKSFGPDDRGLFVSGMKMKFYPEDTGNCVRDIYIKDKTGGFEKIDPEKTYKIATNSFMAFVGGKYEDLEDCTDLKQYAIIRDVVADYMREKKVIDYKFESRIDVEK